MARRSVVLFFEQRTIPHLLEGKPPVVPFSHDVCLLHFGHECLRKGFTVYYSNAMHMRQGNLKVIEMTQAYPILETKSDKPRLLKKISPEFIAMAIPALEGDRTVCPNAKFIAFIPSSALFEAPKDCPPEWVHAYLMAARNQVDFYVVQNKRMAEVARALFCLVGRVDLEDRILDAHLGIVKEQRAVFPPRKTIRAEMELGPRDLAFINSGGPWRWTDYNTFLRAFCKVVHSGVTNIKYYVMGFRQPGNLDHAAYIEETMMILAENADLVGKNVIVYNDWYKASAKVVQFTHAADIGVNVSKDTAENWQSYRVRFIEYMKAGIPVINTTGDYLSANDAVDAIYLVKAGDLAGYESVIREAAVNHKLRQQKAQAMRRLAHKFDSRNTYGKLIDKLIALPKRNFAKPKEWTGPFPFALAVRGEGAPAWIRVSEKDAKRRPLVSDEKKAFVVNKIVASTPWRGGVGVAAMPYQLVAKDKLSAKDKIMTVGFKLDLFRQSDSDWTEVLQVGSQRAQMRLLSHVRNAHRRGYTELSIAFYDNKAKLHDTPLFHIKNDKLLSVIIQVVPKFGLIRVKLNKKTYEVVMKPWDWINVDRLWIGSRRLKAVVKDLWITHENLSGKRLPDLKPKRKSKLERKLKKLKLKRKKKLIRVINHA
jgi:glycosyltransferase involved in cell wall biosynthesis